MNRTVISGRNRKLNVIKIFLGVFLLAFSINVMFEPVNMVTGGFSGLAIIIKKLSAGGIRGGIPVWITTTVLNVPLFIIAMKMKGFKYMWRSLLCSVLFSFFLSVIPVKNVLGGDLLLISVFGGVLTGAARGLLFSSNATTGGADLLASLTNKVLKQYTVTEIIQVIDGIIILFGIWTFGIKMAMYALIAIVIASRISEWMLEGMKISKMSYIISEHNEEIAEKVLTEMKRGVTRISAKGGYSGEDREMLICVTSRKEIVRLKEITSAIDKKAFVIVSDVREVFGEGFIENS